MAAEPPRVHPKVCSSRLAIILLAPSGDPTSRMRAGTCLKLLDSCQVEHGPMGCLPTSETEGVNAQETGVSLGRKVHLLPGGSFCQARDGPYPEQSANLRHAGVYGLPTVYPLGAILAIYGSLCHGTIMARNVPPLIQ